MLDIIGSLVRRLTFCLIAFSKLFCVAFGALGAPAENLTAFNAGL
jgi:hypothetical protein